MDANTHCEKPEKTLKNPLFSASTYCRVLLYGSLAVALLLSPTLSAHIHQLQSQDVSKSMQQILSGNSVEGGISVFENAVRHAPKDPVLRLELAIAYEQYAINAQRSGDKVNEVKYQQLLMRTYREACADFPDNMELALAYAIMRTHPYYANNPLEYAESRAAWTHCLGVMERQYERKPSSYHHQCLVTPLLNLARLALAEHKYGEATQLLNRAEHIAPESSVIQNLRDKLSNVEMYASAT